MTPPDEKDPLLCYLRKYALRFGHAPTIREIEVAADFRIKGGLTRCLTALQRVAELEIESW